ncbi:MAG: carboxylating nicotinate-nucleotide diphosphorylase [Asgard group archaeon]|nr:carboxylating nicotinate-nucleotide diphosphorylase [Asgard group archaeon]
MKTQDFPLPETQIKELLKDFLLEDEGYGDITSTILIPPDKKAKARIFTKESCVLAGGIVIKMLFEMGGCKVNLRKEEGKVLKPNTTIAIVTGPMQEILLRERLSLNLLGRMCGIATKTHSYTKQIPPDSNTVVAATRKTTPGLRLFEKYAVVCGGGDTHRLRLDDMVLMKDNHRVIFSSITKAIAKIKETISFSKKIEVEVEDNETMLAAAKAGADIIMLDNYSPAQIKEALKILEKEKLRDKILVELSGGIDEENIRKYATLGADIISSGSLTHSYRSIDVSLEIENEE